MSESARSPVIKQITTKVEEINKISVDVPFVTEETSKYECEIANVHAPSITNNAQAPNITNSQIDKHTNHEESGIDITVIAKSEVVNHYEENTFSASTAINPTDRSKNSHSTICNKAKFGSCDRPGRQSVYENVEAGIGNITLYEAGTDNFDSVARDNYLTKQYNPPEEKPSLQDKIKENSDNFSTYLKKYGDNTGSARNTVPSVRHSIKLSNEEDDILSLEVRKSSLETESQIIQDINSIEHTLQLIQYDTLDYDVPKKFSLNGNDAEVLYMINQSTPQRDIIPQAIASHHPKQSSNEDLNINHKTNGNDKNLPETQSSPSSPYIRTPPPNSRL